MSLAMVFVRLAEGVDFSAIKACDSEPMNIRRSRIRYRVNRPVGADYSILIDTTLKWRCLLSKTFAPRETSDRTRRDREDAEFGL